MMGFVLGGGGCLREHGGASVQVQNEDFCIKKHDLGIQNDVFRVQFGVYECNDGRNFCAPPLLQHRDRRGNSL